MKNFIKLLGIIALVAVVGFSAMGCTTTSYNGTTDPHGLFSTAGAVRDDSTEVANYYVVLGLFNLGWDDYAAKVKAAEAQGKQLRSVSTWWFFFTSTTAYVK